MARLAVFGCLHEVNLYATVQISMDCGNVGSFLRHTSRKRGEGRGKVDGGGGGGRKIACYSFTH